MNRGISVVSECYKLSIYVRLILVVKLVKLIIFDLYFTGMRCQLLGSWRSSRHFSYNMNIKKSVNINRGFQGKLSYVHFFSPKYEAFLGLHDLEVRVDLFISA